MLGCRLLLFRNIGDEGFSGEHQSSNASRVLKSGAGDLGGIDDAGLNQVLELVGLGVVAEVRFFRFTNLADHNRAFLAGVVDNLSERLFQSALHNFHAGHLIIVLDFEIIECRRATHQSNAAARDNAFFHGCAGRVHGIFDAGFLFLHFGFGCGAHFDYGNATHQLRQPLLQLLAVVVAGDVLDLSADFLYAAFDLYALAFAFHDRGVVLVDGDFLGAAKVAGLDAFQFEAEVFRNSLTAGQNGDILQHGLTTIAEARRLHGADLQCATQLVDHQGRERFAINIFRDYEQRTALLGNLLQDGEEVLHAADLLFIDQDVGIFQSGFHALGIGYEVRGKIAAVELHSFHHFQQRFHGARLFHRDHAVFADLLHRFGNDAADGLVIVRRDGSDLGNHVAADRLGQAVQEALAALAIFSDGSADGVYSALNAPLQGHRVGAGGNGLYAVAIDGLRQNGSGGSAVASHVAGLAGDFSHHLCTHVLQVLTEFDFLGHRHAVLSDDG